MGCGCATGGPPSGAGDDITGVQREVSFVRPQSSAPSVAAPPIEPGKPAGQDGPLAITHLYVDNAKVDQQVAKATLGETLEVEIAGVARLVNESLAKNKPIGLFLDGQFLKDVEGYNPPGSSVVAFTLKRSAENKDVWGRALGRPLVAARKAQIAVGFEDRSMVTSQGSWYLRVSLFNTGINLLLLVPILLIIVSAYVLGRYTRLLRDPSTNKYSLGKTQMAAWFANIAVAYLFIWLATSSLDSLNPSLLILMGIGSATAFGSTLLGKGAVAPGAGDGESTAAGRPSFFNDLLSDGNDPSLARLQIIGWTCILIIVFWSKVLRDFAMPDFSDSVLALMGVSSGTYLGFKFQDKNVAAKTAATDPAGAPKTPEPAPAPATAA